MISEAGVKNMLTWGNFHPSHVGPRWFYKSYWFWTLSQRLTCIRRQLTDLKTIKGTCFGSFVSRSATHRKRREKSAAQREKSEVLHRILLGFNSESNL